MVKKYIAHFTFEFRGEDLETRGALAALMAMIQMDIEKYKVPVIHWQLDTFTKVN